MTAWADGLARSWSDIYTRGLPEEAAARRRAEVRSDLFEHAAVAGATSAQQVHVLGRVLWGIPADLSWRRAARASSDRRLATGAHMTLRKTSTVLVGLMAAFEAWAAIGVWIGVGAEKATDAGGPRYGIPLLLAAALLCYALGRRDEAPWLSTALILAGAAAPMVILFWMAPLFVPLWLLVSGVVLVSTPRGRPSPRAST